MEQVTCLECSRVISPSDTVVSHDIRLVHLDCQRPRAFSAQERALLIYYCWDHVAVQCPHCSGHFRVAELAADFLDSRTYLCPRCGEDITNEVRTHLYGCRLLPQRVRRRAQALREASRALVKQSRQLCDVAEVLVQEADVALFKRRKFKQRLLNDRR